MSLPMDPKKTAEVLNKHGWKPLVITVISSAIIGFISGLGGGKFAINNTININSIETETGESSDKTNNNTKEDEVIKESDAFNPDDWEINTKRIEKEKIKGDETGYFCVKESDVFDSSEIWYKDKVSTGSTINMRYLVKTNKEISQREPILIFIYGKERVFRIFFPDSDPYRIGFEDNSTHNTHKPKRLEYRIDHDKEISLSINISSNPPNQAVFSYGIKYIPLIEDHSEEISEKTSPNSFTSIFPWPNPESDGANQKIGIGTFNGSCFKPTFFKVKR